VDGSLYSEEEFIGTSDNGCFYRVDGRCCEEFISGVESAAMKSAKER